MSKNVRLIFLIEKAGRIEGNKKKLAVKMGIAQTVLSDWKMGRKKCGPADRARLAFFAEEDAIKELVKATIEQATGTLKGEQLARALRLCDEPP